MKTIPKTIYLSVLTAVLMSCSSLVPEPTPTSTPTQTSLPTSTNTTKPTNTSTKTPVPPSKTPSAPVLQMPSGKPLSEWQDIPVMPNAIAGEGDDKGYSFTVDASPDLIVEFYETELTRMGWYVLAVGQGTTDAVLLVCTKEGGMLSVSIIPQPDGITYVLLVK
ncbi:MAG: hypothetical protein PVF83_04705 [Anaerolineales bacterium]